MWTVSEWAWGRQIILEFLDLQFCFKQCLQFICHFRFRGNYRTWFFNLKKKSAKKVFQWKFVFLVTIFHEIKQYRDQKLASKLTSIRRIGKNLKVKLHAVSLFVSSSETKPTTNSRVDKFSAFLMRSGTQRLKTILIWLTLPWGRKFKTASPDPRSKV